MAKSSSPKRASFAPLTSTEEIVRDHLKASNALQKRLMSSKVAARKFLIGAGILTKDGKKLAKPYR